MSWTIIGLAVVCVILLIVAIIFVMLSVSANQQVTALNKELEEQTLECDEDRDEWKGEKKTIIETCQAGRDEMEEDMEEDFATSLQQQKDFYQEKLVLLKNSKLFCFQ